MRRWSLVALVVSVFAQRADAVPVTYALSTTVFSAQCCSVSPAPLEFGDPNEPVATAYGTLGELLRLTVTIEDHPVDSLPGDPIHGIYPSAVLALTLQVGDLVFEYDPGRPGASATLAVHDFPDPQADGVFLDGTFGPGILPAPMDEYDLHFLLASYPNAKVFGDGVPYLPAYGPWGFQVYVDRGANSNGVGGYSAPLTFVAPEPSVLLLLGTAAFALGLTRARARR